MHSWRVLLLKHAPPPYPDLSRDSRFDEPWDGGPHNRQLAGRIGEFYRRQGLDPEGTHRTSFVAVVGAETAWPGGRCAKKSDLTDGLSSTILLVEMADSGIDWMEPRDLSFDGMSFRINDSSGRAPGSKIRGARVLLANGKVHELPDDVDPATLRAMLTAQGGEPIEETKEGWRMARGARAQEAPR